MKKARKPNTTKIQADFRRTAYKVKHDYLNFEHVIIAIAIILCISWAWRAISSVSRNWDLEQRLSSREKELSALKLNVENLSTENAYYQSAEYQELAARDKQNKKLPGETMIYLPDNTEAAKTKHQVEKTEVAPETASNVEQWLSFLFGS